MTQKRYSDEFKEQIISECQETGNVAMVARRHEISANTKSTLGSENTVSGVV